MIKPHGSEELQPRYVEDSERRAELENHASILPRLELSSAGAANAVMLGAGYFNPLQGYMDKANCLSVATTMKTQDGLFWPTPVMCLVNDAGSAEAQDFGLHQRLRPPPCRPYWHSWCRP